MSHIPVTVIFTYLVLQGINMEILTQKESDRGAINSLHPFIIFLVLVFPEHFAIDMNRWGTHIPLPTKIWKLSTRIYDIHYIRSHVKLVFSLNLLQLTVKFG